MLFASGLRKEGGSVHASCAVPMLVTDDAAGEWVELAIKKVRSSQQTSMDRAKSLIDDKLSLIRTIS